MASVVVPWGLRIRGCIVGVLIGLAIGSIAGVPVEALTVEGSIVRGTLATVLLVGLPVFCGIKGFRDPPTITRRTRRVVVLIGVAVVALGVAAFIFLAGLILVGLAIVAGALLAPIRPGEDAPGPD